ncbi:MAG: B12-binding domain-containing radical SAM protein [Candidatus Bathyarchaeales archaeon]
MTTGTKIVLTASATEMSDFSNNPFMAFSAGFGLGPIPLGFARKTLYPPVPRCPDGRAKYAPYGLRKVEAILLENGFSESDVVVAHPFDLDNFVGPNTKVVGISSMDPMGLGYVSKTYSSIIGGGEPMNAIEFRKLVTHPSIKKFRPKIIVGGFGSWQLERKRITDKYGVDCVVVGGRPDTIIEVFKKAVNGEPLPRVVSADESIHNWNYRTMPLIKHAAIHGAVEISKGCGRKCQFCTPTMQSRVDVPLDHVLQEVSVTTSEGSDHITLVTEDLFLYGMKSKSFIPNKEAVVKLVKSVADHPGVKSIQVSHMSLAPVVNNPQMIKELAEILIERSWYSLGKKAIITAETGIETGSVRLIKKYMAGKMLPYTPEQWQEIVTSAFGILNDNNWCPLATLIIGLPDEKEEDVLETLELMDKLRGYKAFYVPLFFVPLENCMLMNKKGAEIDSLTRARWDFFIRCWEYNIKIWKHTFLENRIRNPLLFKFINNIFIPCFAKVAGLYYGWTRGEQLKRAFWTLGMPQAAK